MSFGLKVVQNEPELRETVAVIFNEHRQAVLAAQFVGGREVNVRLLGNEPLEAFPPVDLVVLVSRRRRLTSCAVDYA